MAAIMTLTKEQIDAACGEAKAWGCTLLCTRMPPMARASIGARARHPATNPRAATDSHCSGDYRAPRGRRIHNPPQVHNLPHQMKAALAAGHALHIHSAVNRQHLAGD